MFKLLRHILFGGFLICTSVVYAQDTLVVQGTVSTTTSSSVSNIPVRIIAFDSLTTDSAFTLTDSFGFYLDTIIKSQVNKVSVAIPTCLPSNTNLFTRTQNVVTSPGLNVVNQDMSGYCFETDFTYFNDDDSVTFNSTVSGGVAPFSYSWDFGDTSTGSTFPNPIHYYNALGPIYTVQLNVIDSLNDTARASVTFNINDCQAGFTAIDSGSNRVYFNNLSSSPTTATYIWDFGDGNSDTTFSPLHQYAGTGTYVVELVIIDSGGFCSDVFIDSILVDSLRCQAGFSFNRVGNIVSFVDNSTSVGVLSNLSHTWFFGDGFTVVNDTAPAHVYGGNGNYSAQLIISDASINCLDTSEQLVTILSVGPSGLILSGKVDNNFNAPYSRVYLIESANNEETIIDSMNTVKGLYSFNIQASTVYFVQARADEINAVNPLIPANYYEDSHFWGEATAIAVISDDSRNNDIVLSQSNLSTGNSSIKGKVSYDPGTSVLEALAGVSVYLLTDQGQFLSREPTISNGTYEFLDLPQGSYLVRPDMPGKYSQATRLDISADNTHYTDIDFTLTDEMISDIPQENLLQQSKIFPNPFSQALQVQFPAQFRGAELHMQLFHVSGQLLREESTVLHGNVVELNGDGLTAGVYYLILEIDGERASFLVQKMK